MVLQENVLTSNEEDEIKYNSHVTLCYILLFTALIHSLFVKEITEDEFVNSVKEGLKTFSLTKSKDFLDLVLIQRSTMEVNTEDAAEKIRRGF